MFEGQNLDVLWPLNIVLSEQAVHTLMKFNILHKYLNFFSETLRANGLIEVNYHMQQSFFRQPN